MIGLDGFTMYSKKGSVKKYYLVSVAWTYSFNNKNKIWVEDRDKSLGSFDLTNSQYYPLNIGAGDWLAIHDDVVEKITPCRLHDYTVIGDAVDKLDYIVAFLDNGVMTSSINRIKVLPSNLVTMTKRDHSSNLDTLGDLLPEGSYYFVYLSVIRSELGCVMCKVKGYVELFGDDVYLLDVKEKCTTKL